jgi:uncharacterized membrane protein YhaH (DUF805 family)
MGRGAFVASQVGLYVGLFLVPVVLALLMEHTGGRGELGLGSAAGVAQSLLCPLAFYMNLCLHLKRLRDAGRGPGSLVAMIVFSIAATVAALVLGAWLFFSASGLNYSIPGVLVISLANLLVVTWLGYGLWVALGEPRGALSPESPTRGFSSNRPAG